MRIVNLRNGYILADNVQIARCLPGRLIGLMFRKSFTAGSAYVIPGCRQVHTFLVRFPIDAVFIDARYSVVSIVERLRPNAVSAYCRKAHCVVELPEGTVSAADLKVGDVLHIGD